MRRFTLPLVALLGALCAAGPASAATPVYRGKLIVRHFDDFKHERGQTTWTLRTARGRSLPLLPTRHTQIPSGSKVTVRGHRAGHFIEGRVARRGGARLHAATATGNHSVAVVLLNFATDTREPWSSSDVKTQILTGPASSAAFYDEQSHGDVTLSGDVYGWYTIDAPTAGCNVDLWASKAAAAANAAGAALSNYDHVQYVFPSQSSCGWAGLGELGGKRTWLNGDISVRVAAHELGHNMGLHHASSYTCRDASNAQVMFSGNCTASEYGDPFDVMGLNARHSNAWHLLQLGVLRAADVKTVSSSGTYRLRSAFALGTDPTLLRVDAGDPSGHSFDLSLRRPDGVFDNFSPTAPVVNGLSVHYDPSPSLMTQSLLLDATPGVGGFTDSALAQGRTFASGGVSITVSSVTAGAATVDVVINPAPDTVPPTVPGGLVATPRQGAVDLGWQAAGDNVGVAGYRVYRDDSLVATTTSTSFADTNLVPGSTHKYAVEAFDSAGNSAKSAAVWTSVPAAPAAGGGGTGSPTFTVPGTSTNTSTSTPPPNPGGGTSTPPPPSRGDTRDPVVRVLTPAAGARLRRAATIFAKAGDDTRVTRITLMIDGVRVASARGSRIKRTWSLRRVRPGSHLVLVRAYDAAGNFGTRVVRVHVKH